MIRISTPDPNGFYPTINLTKIGAIVRATAAIE